MGARTRTPPTVPRTEDPRLDSTNLTTFRRAMTILTLPLKWKLNHPVLVRTGVAQEVTRRRLGAMLRNLRLVSRIKLCQ